MTIPKRTAVVTGGRDYHPTRAELEEMAGVLERRDIELVINGGARGVDRDVHNYLVGRYEQRTMPADWKTHGRAAGPLRNREMLSQPGVRQLIAFYGRWGTWDCVQTAKRLGIDVHVIGEGKW